MISNPQTQDVLDTVHADAHRHVARLGDYTVVIADLNAERIKEDYWVEPVELMVLPDHDLV